MIKDYLIGIDDLDGNPMTYQDCCDILNKLTDENEQLTNKVSTQAIHIDFLRDEHIDFKSVLEENRKLKKENQGIQEKVIRLLDYVETKQCVT